MKKKILLSLLLVLSMLIFTGCGKKVEEKEKITIKDSKLNYVTTFEYDKEDGFEFIGKETGGRFSEITFKNEKENLNFDMYYSESTTETAENVKKNRSENKYYKEYKFGEYNGYVYGNYKDSLNLIITLKEDKKEHDCVELFVSIDTINYDADTVVFDLFKKPVITNFFKSIKNTVK